MGGFSGIARDAGRRRRATAATTRRGRAASPSEGMLAGGVGERLAQAEVGGGEGVGKTQRAHGDVLRRPFADAPDAAQAVDHLAVGGGRAETQFAPRGGGGEVADGLRPGAGEAEGGEVGRRSAAASASGVGARRASGAKGVSTGSPKRAASRPASVVAPATLICWPSTARTASSNTSHAPGTRSPGCARTDADRVGSAPGARRRRRGWRRDRTARAADPGWGTGASANPSVTRPSGMVRATFSAR